MRDPYDIMNYYQTNILCETYTDFSKLRLSKKEKVIETKISKLFLKVEDLIQTEELEVVDKINDKFLHKKVNYEQLKLEQQKCPISTSHLMNEILNDKKQDTTKKSKKHIQEMEITLENHTIVF